MNSLRPRLTSRCISVIVILVGLGLVNRSHTGEAVPKLKFDIYGDPLPTGAIARFGTTHLRASTTFVTFADDGKTFISLERTGLRRVWNAADGRLITHDMLTVDGNTRPIGGVWHSSDGKTVVFHQGNDFEIWDVQSGKRLQTPTPDDLHRIISLSMSDDRRWLFWHEDEEAPKVAGVNPVPVPANPRTSRLRIWDAKLGVGRELSNKETGAFYLAISPDGSRYAATSVLRGIRVWNEATGKSWRDDKVRSTQANFSPDGRFLYIWDGKAQRVLNAETGELTEDFKLPEVSAAFAFSPSGKLAFYASPTVGGVLWDVQKGVQIRQWPMGGMGVYSRSIFSPDEKRVLVYGSLVRLWDVETGKSIYDDTASKGHVGNVTQLYFLPDNRHLVSIGTDKTLRIWDVGTMKSGGMVRMTSWPVLWDVTADGKYLLGLGADLSVQKVTLATGHVDKGISLKAPEPGWVPHQIRAMPDGETLLVVAREHVLTPGDKLPGAVSTGPATKTFSWWDLKSGEVRAWGAEEKDFKPAVASSVTTSPDGRLAIGSGMIFDTKTGQKILPKPASSLPPVTLGPILNSTVFSPDSRFLATRPKAEMITILCVPGGEALLDVKAKPALRSIFSRDGHTFASVSLAAELSAWDLNTGASILQGIANENPNHTPTTCNVLAMSADNRLLATASSDGTILLWPLPRAQSKGALEPSELTKLWGELLSENRLSYQRAVWRLAENPKAAVPFLVSHFPAKDNVEFDWRKLVKQLDSDNFEERELAMSRLSAISSGFEEGLRQALHESKSAEQRARLELLLDNKGKPALPSEDSRLTGVVAALEACATPEARAALEDLSHRLSDRWSSEDETLRALERMRWISASQGAR